MNMVACAFLCHRDSENRPPAAPELPTILPGIPVWSAELSRRLDAMQVPGQSGGEPGRGSRDELVNRAERLQCEGHGKP